ncbi:hypothetical protein [Neisseria dumasiana]|uniref:hypothetical protein n=1 Tax=Neisseria dumasiana TaxID=1931275 RepID=UPI000F78C2CD|nr:hypothetical protein [Neisseria dumasiana]
MNKFSLLTLVFFSAASLAASKPYVVKLTGYTGVEGEDTLVVGTSKGKKYFYYFGMDKASQKALDRAIKKKSCVRISEGRNPNEMHSGAVVRPAACQK